MEEEESDFMAEWKKMDDFTDKLTKWFEKHDGEYLEFEQIQNPQSKRPDLHAFLFLDSLDPDGKDIICGSSHGEIYLEVNLKKLIDTLTEDQVIELIRCGVRFDGEGFSMFV